MYRALIRLSIAHPGAVVVGVLCLAMIGAFATTRLPLDPLPDFVVDQLQVYVVVEGRSATEIDEQVCLPLLRELQGLPGSPRVRAVSQPGLAAITVTYPEAGDPARRRAEVNERLGRAKLPPGIHPQIAPSVTPLGEILDFELVAPPSVPLEDRRWVLERIVAPALREVKGVLAVNVQGGAEKGFEVLLDNERATTCGITAERFVRSLDDLQSTSSAQLIDGRRVQAVAHPTRGAATDGNLLEKAVLATADGHSVTVGDVATVRVSTLPRLGYVTRDGKGEVVIGQILLEPGSNAREVSRAAKQALKDNPLPPGYTVDILYDRSELTERSMATILENQLIGVLLVVLLLWIILRNWRAAVVASIVIPVSMLITSEVMLTAGIAASLLSLGAIDFGIAVDSTVIGLENVCRRLRDTVHRTTEQLIESFMEVRAAAGLGEIAIIIALIPFWFLPGREGQLFRPQIMTFQIVLLACLFLSVTLVPALSIWVARGGASRHETESSEEPDKSTLWKLLIGAAECPAICITVLVLLLGLGAWAISTTRWEFMPRFDEGDLLIGVEQPPERTPRELREQILRIEALLASYPEVRTVYSKSGSAEIATDPMPLNESDMYVLLNPPARWRPDYTKYKLKEELRRKIAALAPDVTIEMSQPMEWRTAEATGGEPSDVAVIFRSDGELRELIRAAAQFQRWAAEHPAVEQCRVEQVGRARTTVITPDAEALRARHMHPHAVTDTLRLCGGVRVGYLRDTKWGMLPLFTRYDLKPQRELRTLQVLEEGKESVPLLDVAVFDLREMPVSIARHGLARAVVVHVTLKPGESSDRFVRSADEVTRSKGLAEKGISVSFGGKHAEVERGRHSLLLACLCSMPLVFGLIHYSAGAKLRLTLLAVVTAVVAAAGGLCALAIRDLPLSMSSGIGIIAAVGVSQQFYLVWVGTAEELRKRDGGTVASAAAKAAHSRSRAILMTALTDVFGFMAVALSTSAGAEIQRPLATAVIGGVTATTAALLFLIPGLYATVWRKPEGR